MSFIINYDGSSWILSEFIHETEDPFLLLKKKKRVTLGKYYLAVQGLRGEVITCSSWLKK